MTGSSKAQQQRCLPDRGNKLPQSAVSRRVALLSLQAMAYLAMLGLAYAIGKNGRHLDEIIDTGFALIVMIGFPVAWIAIERKALGWWLLLIVPLNAIVTWTVFVVCFFAFNFQIRLV